MFNRLKILGVLTSVGMLLLPFDAAFSAPAGAETAAVHPDTDEQRIADLITANHILFDQGVLDAFGHISVRSIRNPNHFFLSRSRPPGLVTRADILEFDLDSNPVEAHGESLYNERFIHGEVYRARPDVQSVVHDHSTAVLPFSVTKTPLQPVTVMAGFLAQSVPIFEIRDVPGNDGGMLVQNSVLGAALAKTLGNSSVALMRGHGMIAVGSSVRSVVYRAVYTQVNAQVETEALKLGPVVFLNTAESAKMEAIVAEGDRRPGDSRQWLLWQAQADGHARQLGGGADK